MEEQGKPAGGCRVVVLFSGGGSNLQALLDAAGTASSAYTVIAAITNKADAFGLERARLANVDRLVIDHRQFPSRAAFDQVLADAIDGYLPDLVILAGFMRILSDGFVRHFAGRLINIHPSLLPKYPGLHTHQRAIDAGDTQAGCSVHFVTQELDGGPTIMQACVPIVAGDTANSLANRVLLEEHRIYPIVANWFAQGRLALTEQGVLFDGNVLPASGHALQADESTASLSP
jgi:phosphoribosylglycinamide formyltransferase-1